MRNLNGGGRKTHTIMKLLEGKTIRDEIKKDLEIQIKALKQRGILPALLIIQIGHNPASNIYIQNKKEFGSTIGVNIIHKKFKEDITEKEILDYIEEINNDSDVHGIIVQLPIPNNLNKSNILEAVDPKKDADGLHPKSQEKDFWPATTRGILTLFKENGIELRDKNILMIGASELVGIPTAKALRKNGANVTVADISIENLTELCLKADIIVSAVGKPGLVTKNMVKAGQIIIDVGTTKVGDELKGDVDFNEVKEIVSAITPVPGGIGPLTVASLFQNLLDLTGDLTEGHP